MGLAMGGDAALGSSPLARGLQRLKKEARVKRRIIPARAGFTFTILGDGITDRDHPRSRGVYNVLYHGRVIGAGSSPLARGLRDNAAVF